MIYKEFFKMLQVQKNKKNIQNKVKSFDKLLLLDKVKNKFSR
jgi:hypothetical protein